MKKTIITGIVTFILGGGVGYLVTKKALEGYYAELAQEEIDDVKSFYEMKFNKMTQDSADAPEEMTEEQYEASVEKRTDKNYETKGDKTIWPRANVQKLHEKGYTITEIADKLGMTDGEVQDYLEPVIKSPLARDQVRPGGKVAYHDMAKENMKTQLNMPRDSIEHHNVFDRAGARKEINPIDDAMNEPADDGYEHERDLSGIDRTGPYEISSDEYNDEFLDHDKVSIYYYMLDDTLCDEHEEVMDDIAGTVGLDFFKTLENHPTAWVRNERLAIDYEICVVRSSYAEVVQGVPHKAMSPREQYLNRQRRGPNDDE